MIAKTEIEETNRIYTKAKLEGDVDTLVNGFTDDAILLFPDTPPLSGKEEIRAYYQERYSKSVDEKLDLIQVEDMGDLALVCGRWEEDGFAGKYLEVQERGDDGSWCIKRLCIQIG